MINFELFNDIIFISLFYSFQRISRTVLGIKISDQSYAMMKEIIQMHREYKIQMDLQYSIELILTKEKDFVQNEQQFKDVVRILNKITNKSINEIQEEILKYYKTYNEQSYQKLDNMSKYLNFDPTPEDSPEEEPVSVQTSTKRTHVQKPKINPQKIIEYYTKEKKYSQPAFSMPLLPQITFQPKILDQQLQEKIIFTYKSIYLPEVKFLAVPNITDIRISNQKMFVNPFYQNESYDVPDIGCQQNKLFEFINQIPQEIDFPYNIRISTNKPVPQHHSLLDFTGLYGSIDEIQQQLIEDITFDYKNNLQQELTIFEIFQKYLSNLFYFGPLNIVVDNRHSGNVSRLLRFGLNMNKDETAYIFATYIDGCLKLQVNASQDLGKDTEIVLGINNSVFKHGSQLFNYLVLLCRYYYQMNQQYRDKEWKQYYREDQIDERLEQIYLLNLHQIKGQDLLQKITVEKLIELIKTDFINSQYSSNEDYQYQYQQEQELQQKLYKYEGKLDNSVLSLYYSPYYKAEYATFQLLNSYIENQELSWNIVSLLFDELTEYAYDKDKDRLSLMIQQIIKNNFSYEIKLSFQQYYKLIGNIWQDQRYQDTDVIQLARQSFYNKKITKENYQNLLAQTFQLQTIDENSLKKQENIEKQCSNIADFLLQCVRYNPCYTQQFSKAKSYENQVIQLQMAHVGYIKQEQNFQNLKITDYCQQQINLNTFAKNILSKIFKGIQYQYQNKDEDKSNYQSAVVQMLKLQENKEEYKKIVQQALDKTQQNQQQKQ